MHTDIFETGQIIAIGLCIQIGSSNYRMQIKSRCSGQYWPDEIANWHCICAMMRPICGQQQSGSKQIVIEACMFDTLTAINIAESSNNNKAIHHRQAMSNFDSGL